MGFLPSSYGAVAAGYLAYMALLWALRRPLRNDGLVDFGWPTGLVGAAVYAYAAAPAPGPRTAVICAMYGVCGLRMTLGWLERLRGGEDRRWPLWRAKWAAGRGLLGVRSLAVNFFVYYQAQAVGTVVALVVPLFVVAAAPRQELSAFEGAAALGWLAFFALENAADWQLFRYRCAPPPKPPVLATGLWRYSRHPNYFCELMLWVSYALYAAPAADGALAAVLLAAIPVLAYWFLTAFTGIPMTEASSLASRGEPYRRYQARTSAFFPRPPKG